MSANRDAYRPAPNLTAFRFETGQEVLVTAIRFSILQGNANDVVAGSNCAVPRLLSGLGVLARSIDVGFGVGPHIENIYRRRTAADWFVLKLRAGHIFGESHAVRVSCLRH